MHRIAPLRLAVLLVILEGLIYGPLLEIVAMPPKKLNYDNSKFISVDINPDTNF